MTSRDSSQMYNPANLPALATTTPTTKASRVSTSTRPRQAILSGLSHWAPSAMTNARGNNSAASASTTNSQGVLMVGPNFKKSPYWRMKMRFIAPIFLIPVPQSRIDGAALIGLTAVLKVLSLSSNNRHFSLKV
uniref:Uncharacterized protein n=1 Tax=Caenorhabditis japonica TaxID=281687 RepID=A0A8R1EDT9_CAEJA